MFCLFFGSLVGLDLLGFWGWGYIPPLWFFAQQKPLFLFEVAGGQLDYSVASEPVMEYVKCTWMILKLAICFRIYYSPKGPGGIEYCCVIPSYICSNLLSPFHCQMDDLHEWKPQFLIQMSSIIIHICLHISACLSSKSIKALLLSNAHGKI